MNHLTALLYAIPDAVARHNAEKQKEEEYRIKDTQRHRKYADRKTRASGMTRDQEQAVERARWLEVVLKILSEDEPMSSVELGNVMGVARCTAYRRLVGMAKEGHVVREGVGVATKWRRADHGR